jgi:hypothetical protein
MAASVSLTAQTGESPSTTRTGISVSSPSDYQVFQRSTSLKGKIEIRGKALVPADLAEARLMGTSLRGPLPDRWIRLSFHKSTGEFHASLPAAAGGFYQLQVRLLRAKSPMVETTIPHVGVGEVFVVSGQSNSTNYGEVQQATQTSMVVSFDGTSWQIANDPQPGVQDHSRKGSFIPSFGDALYRKYHVPIGVASVGRGSTSVRQWLPAGDPVYVMPTMTNFVNRNAKGELVSDGALFNGMMQRIHQLGKHGFRAVLWHQGESDARQAPEHQISETRYREMMIRLIRSSRKSAGWNFPWFVAVATYHSPQDPSTPSFQEAQRSLWHSGIAIAGPNTDTLGSPYRQNNGQGVHLNDAGLKAHGSMWAEMVERYLDSVTAGGGV